RELVAGRSNGDFEICEGNVGTLQISASLLEAGGCGGADVRLDESLSDQSDADVRVLACGFKRPADNRGEGEHRYLEDARRKGGNRSGSHCASDRVVWSVEL